MPNAIRIDSMSITFNTDGGNHNEYPLYYKTDVIEVLAQVGCEGVRALDATVDGTEATLLVGVDAAGQSLTAGSNLAAIPCPVWCKGF